MPPTPGVPVFMVTTLAAGFAGFAVSKYRFIPQGLAFGNFSSGPTPPSVGQTFPTGR